MHEAVVDTRNVQTISLQSSDCRLFCPRTQCTMSGLVAPWYCSWIDCVNLPKLCLCFITPICWFLWTGVRVEVHFTGRRAIDCIRFELSSYGFTISSMFVCDKSVRIKTVVVYSSTYNHSVPMKEKLYALMTIHSLTNPSDLYLIFYRISTRKLKPGQAVHGPAINRISGDWEEQAWIFRI